MGSPTYKLQTKMQVLKEITTHLLFRSARTHSRMWWTTPKNRKIRNWGGGNLIIGRFNDHCYDFTLLNRGNPDACGNSFGPLNTIKWISRFSTENDGRRRNYGISKLTNQRWALCSEYFATLIVLYKILVLQQQSRDAIKWHQLSRQLAIWKFLVNNNWFPGPALFVGAFTIR